VDESFFKSLQGQVKKLDLGRVCFMRRLLSNIRSKLCSNMKAAILLILLVLLFGTTVVEVVNANPYSSIPFLRAIVIAADGSISPSNDVISHIGNLYALRKDISGSYFISIYCSNIIFDGDGHTIDSGASSTGFGIETTRVNNVIIENVALQGFYSGVAMFNTENSEVSNVFCFNNGAGLFIQESRYNQVTHNNIVNNTHGITLYANSNENSIIDNNLAKNDIGLQVLNSQDNKLSNNLIVNSSCAIKTQYVSNDGYASKTMPINNLLYQNNFVNNTQLLNQIEMNPANNTFPNYWCYQGCGNYWSDYINKYPNASEIGNTGIGDTPYNLATNNTDYYPLTKPLNIEQPQTPAIANPLPTPIPSPTVQPSSSPTITIRPAASPTTSFVSSPSNSTIDPSPTVPELSWLVIFPLLIVMPFIAIKLFRKRK
jgi:parallel beta-helix repeat protein